MMVVCIRMMEVSIRCFSTISVPACFALVIKVYYGICSTEVLDFYQRKPAFNVSSTFLNSCLFAFIKIASAAIIIEIGGVYVNPTTVQDLYMATGQRYGVLLKTAASSSTNYTILAAMDTNSFDPAALSATPNQNPNVTGALVYNSMSFKGSLYWFDADQHTDKLPILLEAPNMFSFNVIDDFTLVPQDGMLLLPDPVQQFVLALDFWEQQILSNSQYWYAWTIFRHVFDWRVRLMYSDLASTTLPTCRRMFPLCTLLSLQVTLPPILRKLISLLENLPISPS